MARGHSDEVHQELDQMMGEGQRHADHRATVNAQLERSLRQTAEGHRNVRAAQELGREKADELAMERHALLK